jgi:hypothetical protein
MLVDLTKDQAEQVLSLINYGKLNVREAQGTPYDVRKENLARLNELEKCIRDARDTERSMPGKV